MYSDRLRKPRRTGCADGAIGTNGEDLMPRRSELILGTQDLSIKPLSDPPQSQITFSLLMMKSSLRSL
jgi:hypothetical protein